MTDDDVVPYVRERLPGFRPVGDAVRLPGGNLNVVWRVGGRERSVIVKYAPPYIAANPDVPLDPSRLLIEARCLEAFGQDGPLGGLRKTGVRPPRPLDTNEEEYVLLMEDVGDLPGVHQWLREREEAEDNRSETASILGRRLGTFTGSLHATTVDWSTQAADFVNQPMQETRHAVQYRGVAEMLSRAGVSDAKPLGARAETLGEALQQPGRCLTMGDLWPPSVLVRGEEIRIIDWELAHYGRPLQDVAHWCAHLWMLARRAPSPHGEDAIEELRASFLRAYREALGDEEDVLWTSKEKRDAAIHYAAEILVRAVGPFQEGYVYAGLTPDHPVVREAVTRAVEALRAPSSISVLEA